MITMGLGISSKYVGKAGWVGTHKPYNIFQLFFHSINRLQALITSFRDEQMTFVLCTRLYYYFIPLCDI